MQEQRTDLSGTTEAHLNATAPLRGHRRLSSQMVD